MTTNISCLQKKFRGVWICFFLESSLKLCCGVQCIVCCAACSTPCILQYAIYCAVCHIVCSIPYSVQYSVHFCHNWIYLVCSKTTGVWSYFCLGQFSSYVAVFSAVQCAVHQLVCNTPYSVQYATLLAIQCQKVLSCSTGWFFFTCSPPKLFRYKFFKMCSIM